MIRAAKWTVLAAYLIACALTWSTLPARIPYHFSINGRADAWADNTLLAWFGLPAVALALVIALDAIGAFSTNSAPQLWNVPEKEKFLALTADKRSRVMSELRTFLDVTAIWCIALMMVVQYQIYVVAVRALDNAPEGFGILLVAATALLIGYTIVFSRRVRKVILDLSAS